MPPIGGAAPKSNELVEHGTLKVCVGAPLGIYGVDQVELDQDIVAILQT